jgi:hypothetical protein
MFYYGPFLRLGNSIPINLGSKKRANQAKDRDEFLLPYTSQIFVSAVIYPNAIN